MNVDLQVVTPNKAEEDLEEEVIKVVDVDYVDQSLKIFGTG